MPIMPQFPLGSVLFPTMMLPLQVFEPRYRALVNDIASEDDPEFGVVMIERGIEVGGDDQRYDVGTIASVLETETFADGRSALICVGTSRFRVLEWLPPNPYPMAEIEVWPDEAPETTGHPDVEACIASLEGCMAMAKQAGYQVSDLPVISDAADTASMQLSALAPVSSFDKQQLLAAPGPDQRLPMLLDALEGAAELLQFRLDDR